MISTLTKGKIMLKGVLLMAVFMAMMAATQEQYFDGELLLVRLMSCNPAYGYNSECWSVVKHLDDVPAIVDPTGLLAKGGKENVIPQLRGTYYIVKVLQTYEVNSRSVYEVKRK